jgi:hypothetical protein
VATLFSDYPETLPGAKRLPPEARRHDGNARDAGSTTSRTHLPLSGAAGADSGTYPLLVLWSVSVTTLALNTQYVV